MILFILSISIIKKYKLTKNNEYLKDRLWNLWRRNVCSFDPVVRNLVLVWLSTLHFNNKLYKGGSFLLAVFKLFSF